MEAVLKPHLLEGVVTATLALYAFGVVDPITKLIVVAPLMKMLNNAKPLLHFMLVIQLMKCGITSNQDMTSNVTDAYNKDPYLGQDSVMVGNGNAYPIFAISNFKIPSTEVTFPNVLIVPSIKKNLISIFQFNKDFNCCFLFHP